MTTLEKLYSLFAIIFAIALITALITFPQLRGLSTIIPLVTLGLFVNIGLLFVVLKDIFFRSFSPSYRRYIWIALVLVIWPSILYYLARYGFKKR